MFLIEYSTHGFFNTRTGKFQQLDDSRNNPTEHFAESNRMARQCSAFFDLETYQEERSRYAMEKRKVQQQESTKKLTKQELEMFKRRKLEKKKAKILRDYRDDL